jgi:hypothetical protein
LNTCFLLYVPSHTDMYLAVSFEFTRVPGFFARIIKSQIVN